MHYLTDSDADRVHSRIFAAESEGLTDAQPGELLLEVTVPWSDGGVVLRGDPVEIVEHLEFVAAKARCTFTSRP